MQETTIESTKTSMVHSATASDERASRDHPDQLATAIYARLYAAVPTACFRAAKPREITAWLVEEGEGRETDRDRLVTRWCWLDRGVETLGT